MLSRITKYSVKNILRNKFLSLSSVLVLTLLMFFINLLVVLEDVSFKLIDGINSKLTISLYLNEEYSKTSLDVIDLIDDIKSIESDIGVKYKTKEDVLNEIRLKEPNLVKILERSNPLPDTIALSNIGLSDYFKINNLIENRLYLFSNDEGDDKYFANYSTQYQKIEDVTSKLNILQLGLYIIILIFVVSISIIMYSVIGNFIYYYKDEIYITKLVGGSNTFIYGPFVLQGIIYSIISFLLSFIIFILILKYSATLFGDIYMYNVSNIVISIELLIFLLIGGLSGFFSSRRYLR